MKIKRVTGRKKALARAMAISLYEAIGMLNVDAGKSRGPAWTMLPESSRQKLIAASMAMVDGFIGSGVLIEFEDNLREGEV